MVRSLLFCCGVLLSCTCRRNESRPSSPEPEAKVAARSSVERPSHSSSASKRKDSDPALPKPQPEASALPVLDAPADFVTLIVEGHADAVVSLPHAATSKRPVLVALHGNYDRPEWQCQVWRKIIRASAFVLCPRGMRRPGVPRALDRWTYAAQSTVEKELLAGLEALKAQYPRYVDASDVVYTGFSLGAILGRSILNKHAKLFTRGILVEGGYRGWSRGFVKRYADGGGKKIMLVCAQTSCRHAARQASRAFKGSAVQVKVVFAGQLGHTYDGPVASAIGEALPWLLGADARWPEALRMPGPSSAGSSEN